MLEPMLNGRRVLVYPSVWRMQSADKDIHDPSLACPIPWGCLDFFITPLLDSDNEGERQTTI
jgi:hypothetical protein